MSHQSHHYSILLSKKLLFALAFFNSLLSFSNGYLSANNLLSENKFINMFLVGQIHFGFLMKDESTKNLTLELISSRELTGEVLHFDFKRGMEFLNVDTQLHGQDLFDDITFSMGGFYELLYQCLKDDRPFDIPHQIEKVVNIIMQKFGSTFEESQNILSSHSFSAEDFKKINQVLDHQILQK